MRIFRDNPGGPWLQKHIAEAAVRERKGIVLSGPVTAWTPVIMLRVDVLSRLPGANGEVRKPGNIKYDTLRAEIAEKGWRPTPILVGVNFKGEAFILEGNTRVAIAAEHGERMIPGEVRWFAGGENHTSGFSPSFVEKLVSVKHARGPVPMEF